MFSFGDIRMMKLLRFFCWVFNLNVFWIFRFIDLGVRVFDIVKYFDIFFYMNVYYWVSDYRLILRKGIYFRVFMFLFLY